MPEHLTTSPWGDRHGPTPEEAAFAVAQTGYPTVRGRCPACGHEGLFLGEGGYVTCPRLDCPEPDAASTLLEEQRKPAPTLAAAVEVRDPCPHCGDHQLIPRHRTTEHVERLHPDERRTTTDPS